MSPLHAVNGHHGPSSAASTASDPVLAALASARDRRDQADRDIRILLAYARELATPRPYRLADLAAATGMSISGVRTTYTRHDTDTARHLIRAFGPPMMPAPPPEDSDHDLPHPAPPARVARQETVDTRPRQAGGRER